MSYLDNTEHFFMNSDEAKEWIKARLEDAVECHRKAKDVQRPLVTTNFDIIDMFLVFILVKLFPSNSFGHSLFLWLNWR